MNKKSLVEEELFGNTGKIIPIKFHYIEIDLDSLTLSPPLVNASISNTKVSHSLKNPHERQKSNIFFGNEKRYALPQTLAAQYDARIKKQRENESLMNSQMVDTTLVLFSKNIKCNIFLLH